MKIGILTFHKVNNYGAVLQAYAFQEVLRGQGHDAFIIDYRPEFIEKTSRLSFPKSFRSLYHNLIKLINNWQFKKFTDKFQVRSQNSYDSYTRLANNPPEADVYIVGSDQVWNIDLQQAESLDIAFFLNFGAVSTVRISYAASFGGDVVDLKYVADVQDLLVRLDGISVREDSGVKLIREAMGRETQWLPDPVFLLEHYEPVFAGLKDTEPTIFIYATSMRKANVAIFKELSRRYSASIYYSGVVTFCKFFVSRYFSLASPMVWLNRLRSARCVLTSSFHGVALSIVFKRAFLYIPPTDEIQKKRAGRIYALLRRLELEDRIMRSADIDEVIKQMDNPVDWNLVSKKILLWRTEAFDFLNRYLRDNKE